MKDLDIIVKDSREKKTVSFVAEFLNNNFSIIINKAPSQHK